MPFTIQMPKLGHTMTEGTVVKWHKRTGDQIRQGEAVLTVETDPSGAAIKGANAFVARFPIDQFSLFERESDGTWLKLADYPLGLR